MSASTLQIWQDSATPRSYFHPNRDSRAFQAVLALSEMRTRPSGGRRDQIGPGVVLFGLLKPLNRRSEAPVGFLHYDCEDVAFMQKVVGSSPIIRARESGISGDTTDATLHGSDRTRRGNFRIYRPALSAPRVVSWRSCWSASERWRRLRRC
jgi:hypothetical protein